MSGFPLAVDLRNRLVVVVGAGGVATRRVRQFLHADAAIHVVAPNASDEIRELAAAGALTWSDRDFDDEDLAGAWLVVTATNDVAVNTRVSQLSASSGTWCINSADAAQATAVPMTSVEHADGIQVAVYGGGDPGRAVAIRDAIAVGLRSGKLPIRPTRSGAEPATGSVTLVGAGPGDPSLLTVRAAQALALADVLVVDRLAPAALWEDSVSDVRVIDVGKEPGKHAVSQDEINKILVREASAGYNVVRIKGGDPFVLGRGGEEALACQAAGIPVTVVPGITSAISVPAAAGIPVTHRGVTSTFVVASAHDGPAGVLAAVSDSPHSSTLVLLMGAGKLPAIAGALVATGRSSATPVAIIESGWTNDQRTTITSLGEAESGTVRVKPPAVVVIGDVVRLREQLGDLGIASSNARHA